MATRKRQNTMIVMAKLYPGLEHTEFKNGITRETTSAYQHSPMTGAKTTQPQSLREGEPQGYAC
jgi:hypothetical protein